MEANTNTAPEDITEIQHQTASWQVCWWAQTRLRVETQLLPYDILNLCPTKSSHILSGLENLPFPRLKALRQIGRVKDRELCCSERGKFELQILHQGVFTIRTVPIDLWYLFEHKVVTCNHTAPLYRTPNFCLALPQTSSLHPVCQRVWVHTINLEREAREEMAEGNSWEVEEVGKWVRGLGPKRRQLPPQHLGLPPVFSTLPSSPLWGVELTVGEGPVRGLQIGSFLQYQPGTVSKAFLQEWEHYFGELFFWQVIWT